MNLNNIYNQFVGGGGYRVHGIIGTIAQNLCKDKNRYDKKHYVCTHYGIQECMTSNDFGNML